MPIDLNNTYCDESQIALQLGLADLSEFDVTGSTDALRREATRQVENYTHMAWRDRDVDDEYHNLPSIYRYNAGYKVFLRKRYIEELRKFEVYNNNGYEDYVANRQQGRDEDYWIQRRKGIVYIRDRVVLVQSEKSVRASYTYNKASFSENNETPAEVQKAAAMLAAATVITGDEYSVTLPDSDIQPLEKARRLQNRAHEILNGHKEIQTGHI
jgi:hypothetical protein